MRVIFCGIIIFFLTNPAFPYSHVHPVPSLPRDINPFTVFDVFGESVVAKVHSTLFIMKNNEPVPQLIEDFNVSRNQLVYTFRLKDLKFHNGKKLGFEDVQYSLESVLRNKSPGYEKLASVIGFSDFMEGKITHLSGLIRGYDDNIFKIILQKPNPLLIYGLVEFRFSIVPADGNYFIGLGKYKIKNFNKSDLTLEQVDKTSTPSSPDTIIYKQFDLSEAVSRFLMGEVDDLFAYPMGPGDIQTFSGKAMIQEIQVPRTYLFALSAHSFPLRKQRFYILNQIDKSDFLNACYQGNVPTQNVIPPGFMGYIKDTQERVAPIIERSLGQEIRLRIDIAKGVGNESCVVKKFKEYFKILGKIEVKVVDTAVGISHWKTKQIDAFFAYFESENTFDFFQIFNPEANFTLGVPDDKKIISLIEDYNTEPLPTNRHIKALTISKHIEELKVVKPIFHPKQYLVYNRRYQPLKTNVQSVTFIRFDQLKLDAK